MIPSFFALPLVTSVIMIVIAFFAPRQQRGNNLASIIATISSLLFGSWASVSMWSVLNAPPSRWSMFSWILLSWIVARIYLNFQIWLWHRVKQFANELIGDFQINMFRAGFNDGSIQYQRENNRLRRLCAALELENRRIRTENTYLSQRIKTLTRGPQGTKGRRGTNPSSKFYPTGRAA